MLDGPSGATSSAVRLALAVSRLRSRIRVEAGMRATGLPMSHLATLTRLVEDGPATAAALASAEHVTHQAITQGVVSLRERGLVDKQPDPVDRRQSLISATPAGRELLASLLASREEWLTRAIEAAVPESEREMLETTIDLLERIAQVDVHQGGEMR